MLAEPGTGAWSERYAPLLRAARVVHLLLAERAADPPAPWQRIAGDGRFALWEHPDSSPIASAYFDWPVWDGAAGSSAEASAAADALRGNALLVAPPASPPPVRVARAPAPVKYRRAAPEHIDLALDAGDQSALVFVSEGYHPWWRARVDGEPAPVWRASLAHMAVPVEAGPHVVELRLERPWLVAAADALSAAAWIALVAGLAVRALRRADP